MLQISAPVIYIRESNPFVLSMWPSVRFIFGLLDLDASHELVLLFPGYLHNLIALKDILFDSCVEDCRAGRLGLVLVSRALTVFKIFFFNQAQIVEF